MTIRNTSNDYYTDDYTTTVRSYYNSSLYQALNYTTKEHSHTSEGLTETNSFQISPRIGIGASFNLIPDRFTVNAGFTAYPFDYTHSVTKVSRNGENTTYTKTVDGLGTTTADTVNVSASSVRDSVAYTDTWGQFTSRIAGGFSFSFGPQFTLDFLAETPIDNTFNINLTNFSVLLAFKF